MTQVVIRKRKNAQTKQWKSFMITVHDPDPSMDFLKYMKEAFPDLARMSWGYEAGDKTGHPHYQVYATTFDQHRLEEFYDDEVWDNVDTGRCHSHMICRVDWLQGAYAPKAAEVYCVKADHTLIPPWDGFENPKVWQHPDYLFRGQRHELQQLREALRAGETYVSLRDQGKCLNALAKYPRFAKELEQDAEQAKYKSPEYPLRLKLLDLDLELLDPKTLDAQGDLNKKRNIWIWGPKSVGKTRQVQKALAEYKYQLVTALGQDVAFEVYLGNEIILFDDCFCTAQQICAFTDTNDRNQVIRVRNVNVTVPGKSVRLVIYLSNKPIAESFQNVDLAERVQARFTEYKVGGVPLEAGMVHEPGGGCATPAAAAAGRW